MVYNLIATMDTTYWTGFPSLATKPHPNPVSNWGIPVSASSARSATDGSAHGAVTAGFSWTTQRCLIRSSALPEPWKVPGVPVGSQEDCQ